MFGNINENNFDFKVLNKNKIKVNIREHITFKIIFIWEDNLKLKVKYL